MSNVASRLGRSQGRDMISAECDGGGNEITVHGNTQPRADAKFSRSPATTKALADCTGITATVTTPYPSQRIVPTTTTQVSTAADRRKFLENVLVWPGSAQAPGWINVHVNAKNTDPTKNGGKPWVAGWPFKTIDEVINRVSWVESTTDFFNVWVCMSQQSECAQKPNGKFKAVRKAANATLLKAIWIDCDVKANDPKHYGTIQDAWQAFRAFHKKVGLPTPSMVVNSGGGLHIYWVSDAPLTPDEWRPYAHGLKTLLLNEGFKCDTGLTTDVARILRVPGTHNHKYQPSRLVELLYCGSAYDFATGLQFLTQVNSGLITPQQSEPDAIFDAPDPLFAALKPDDALQAGATHGPHWVDPKPIFAKAGCGFLREAFQNGGKDYDNPKWNLSVLCTAFMENGNIIAHEISKGHATYDPADTQALYERKVVERRDRGIGYPSCAAIAGAGSEHCKDCPHFTKGKSPLNIRPVVTATVNPAAAEDAPPVEVPFVDPYAEFVGPEFPLDILPPTLANFVNAEHRAMGADPSAIAMAALTAVAGAMHAETQVRAGEGWWVGPILWTALLGQPSTMKSPIIDRSTKPLSRIDHGRDKLWRQQHTTWVQTPNNKTIPSPPKPARCVLNDITPEKVAEVLSRDPSGSLAVQDELAGWLGGFERYSAGQSSRALYLSAWNGGTFLKDRVGKGKNDPDAEVRVDNLALCILGGIQPDMLTKLGDLTSDGLLQRFLPVLMKSANLGDPYYPVAGAEAEYEKLIKSINALPAQNYHFADDALEVRDDVLGYLHKLEQVDGFSPSLIGAIGKLNGYFARICLVLHVARRQDIMIGNAEQSEPLDPSFTAAASEHLRKLFGLPSGCLSDGIAVSSAISRKTAEAAKKMLLEFLLPHMIGLYDVVVNGGQERDKLQSIANFILASDKERLRPSDFRAGVRVLRDEPEQKVRDWAGRFCGMDWVRPEDEKPGVPTKAWLVSPGLRDHFTERRKQVQAARAEIHAILKAGGSRRS
jgi:hypothetical protein